MAYFGVTPSNVFGQGTKDSFNGDGSTTAFTLSRAVLLATDIDVFVGNVRQEPNVAYTVSGVTLTFTGTPASGTGNIYAVHKATSVGTTIPPTGRAENLSTLEVSGTSTLTGNITNSGTITSGGTVAVTGNVTATGTVEPAGDTAAGDNAAIGFTAAEGLILTGQGSTSDITIKNDADTVVASIATGTTVMNFASAITVGGSALSNTATDAAVTGTVVKGTTSLQTPLIEFTDGDDAISIADGGVVTFSQRPVFETGTYTPQMFDAVSGGNTDGAASAAGIYRRIGDFVWVGIQMTNVGRTGMTASNVAHFSLPFTSLNNAANYATAPFFGSILGGTGDGEAQARAVLYPNRNRFFLAYNVDNDNFHEFTVGDFGDDTFDMLMSINYIAAI